ncbi:Splicing factor [Agyrium rufum]|nr:Splicing factor [Agyrium rufum]
MDINSLLSPQDIPVREFRPLPTKTPTPLPSPHTSKPLPTAASAAKPPAKQPVKRTRKPRAPAASKTPTSASSATSTPKSARSRQPLPPPPPPEQTSINAQSRPLLPSLGSNNSLSAFANNSPRGTPPIDPSSTHHLNNHNGNAHSKGERQRSTSGMDTLADLASMQYHQQEVRANAGGLRSTEVHDAQVAAATVAAAAQLQQAQQVQLLQQQQAQVHATKRPTLFNAHRTSSGSRSVLDPSIIEAPTSTPPVRNYAASSLSDTDLKTVAQLVTYLAENPYAYETHVKLVKLLHSGLIAHVAPTSPLIPAADPQTYDLLPDLKQATEAMDQRFALGEELWEDRLTAQLLLVNGMEDCIAVVESFKKATQEETGSTKLWMMYADWMERLDAAAHRISSPGTNPAESATATSLGWSEEDTLLAREVFGKQQIMDVLQQGAEETMYRIHDSHLLWNQWIDMLLQTVGSSPSQEAITAIESNFSFRLRTPHAAWDETFQKFSTFVSTYNNAAYESTMVTITRESADAKYKYTAREELEATLDQALTFGDRAAQWTAFSEYLDWELSQQRNKKTYSFELINALYQRAALVFFTETELWEDYLTFLSDEREFQEGKNTNTVDLLNVLERATRHCPWSGMLWAHYLYAAESHKLPFTEIGQIKHKATSTGLLDAGGMEEVLKVHTAWCGFLRRRAFHPESSDEELDVAEVGIRSAIEDMETIGRQKYGKDYEGDPQYRLERIYIKYLSQTRNWKAARDTWRGLVSRRGDSYEFWEKYVKWEMVRWGQMARVVGGDNMVRERPTGATDLLKQAIKRPNLDWPEKIVDIYLKHCEDHEDVEELHRAIIQARKTTRTIARRRERETKEELEVARAQQDAVVILQGQDPQAALTNGKRKRDHEGDESVIGIDGGSSKKAKPETTTVPGGGSAGSVATGTTTAIDTSSALKRDRENTTVIVKNFPTQTTEERLRRFFRDCGTINNVTIASDTDGGTTSATIEFETKEDVLAAQTRDRKFLDGNMIEVSIGTGATVWVTNFPSDADEAWIRGLFKKYGDVVDIRFPSLKYNTHRRFCYVQYVSPSSAKAASDALDDRPLRELLEPGNPHSTSTHRLKAKISDPSQKEHRAGALLEGRELYVSNLDFHATESEVRTVFGKYGTVGRVRIPLKLSGQSRGTAFVVFEDKESAEKALELNLTKFKNRLLNVQRSEANPAKRQATAVIGERRGSMGSRESASMSPALGASASTTASEPHRMDLDVAESEAKHDVPAQAKGTNTGGSTTHPSSTDINQAHLPSRASVLARSIHLSNIPDTVSDARIRTLCEKYGALVKINLRPGSGTAVVEFINENDAGKAALSLEGQDIAGRKIDVRLGEEGGLGRGGGSRPQQQQQQQKQQEKDRNEGTVGKNVFGGVGLVRRSAGVGGTGRGRGGLRGRGRAGLGFRKLEAVMEPKVITAEGNGDGAQGNEDKMDVDKSTNDVLAETKATEPQAPPVKKSNADFKALFVKGGEDAAAATASGQS